MMFALVYWRRRHLVLMERATVRGAGVTSEGDFMWKLLLLPDELNGIVLSHGLPQRGELEE